jgi:hypothetical protein
MSSDERDEPHIVWEATVNTGTTTSILPCLVKKYVIVFEPIKFNTYGKSCGNNIDITTAQLFYLINISRIDCNNS